MGINLPNLGFSNGSLDLTARHKQQNEKKKKLDFLKIKNLCASKGAIQKVKRQPTEWKKIFPHYISDESLFSIYQELLQLINTD